MGRGFKAAPDRCEWEAGYFTVTISVALMSLP